jgi:hypothetical protein
MGNSNNGDNRRQRWSQEVEKISTVAVTPESGDGDGGLGGGGETRAGERVKSVEARVERAAQVTEKSAGDVATTIEQRRS